MLQEEQDISDLLFPAGLSETILQTEGIFITDDPQTKSPAGRKVSFCTNHEFNLSLEGKEVKVIGHL